MKLEWIEIKRFRSIGEKVVHLDFRYPDGRRNPAVLVGENNAGKSNILSAIQLMFDIIAGQDQATDFDWYLANRGNDISMKAEIKLDDRIIDEMVKIFVQNMDHPIEQDILDQVRNELTDRLLVQILIQEDGKKEDRACFRWGPLCFNLVGVTGLNDCWRGLSSRTNIEIRDFFQAYIEMVEDPHIKEPKKLEAALKQILKSEKDFLSIPQLPKRFGELLASSVVTFSKIRNFPKGEHQSRIDTKDGSDLDTVLVNLMVSTDQEDKKKYEEIKNSFSEIFPFFSISPCQDRETQKPQLRIRRKDGEEFPIQSMGTGTLEILYFLTKLALPEDRLVLIEDPELHLHPQAQRVVMSFLMERSKRNQIILATHSGIFVDLESLQNNFVVQLKNGITDVSFIKVPPTQADPTVLSSLLNTEKGSIFFSRLAVFVDGKTESEALPIFAESRGVDFNKRSIFLFSLEGKNNLEKAIRIADGFSIPWISICDYDAGMEITGSIESTKSPLLFKQLHNLEKISQEHLDFLRENQDKIVKRGKQEFFSGELFQEIHEILKSYGCFLFSSDFEGILEKEGNKEILQEAERVIGRSKPRRGKYAARKIAQENNVPEEVLGVIEYIGEWCK